VQERSGFLLLALQDYKIPTGENVCLSVLFTQIGRLLPLCIRRLSFGFGTTAGEMEEAFRIFEETVVFLLENRRKKVKMPDTL